MSLSILMSGEAVVPEQWRKRPLGERIKEGFAYLAAPLL